MEFIVLFSLTFKREIEIETYALLSAIDVIRFKLSDDLKREDNKHLLNIRILRCEKLKSNPVKFFCEFCSNPNKTNSTKIAI